jgi:alkyl sulfatase BDS1-like metallo-beta-lactamase superfamily hydrolase
MGFQAEAGTWRNIFLLGAEELRNGVDRSASVNTVNPDVLFNMGVGMALDFLGVKFNAEKAGPKPFSILLDFTDTGASHLLAAQNGVLSNTRNRASKADLTLRLTEAAFFRLLGRIATVETLAREGLLAMEGDASKLAKLFGAMDDFDPHFAVVTP